MNSNEPRYDQPEKNEVRRRILTHAVNCLTTGRTGSPVVTLEQFDQTLLYCYQFVYKHTRQDIQQCVEPYAQYWRSLHSARVGKQSPTDLTVLFLCGPHPINDLRVFMELGIPPHNIWAVESDKDAFASAVDELRSAQIHVKVHPGSLQEFFQIVPQQFDLVYFDGCGPLFGGKPNSIHVIREFFLRQRLSPLSVLITNLSAVNADQQHMEIWADRFVAWYTARYDQPVACNSEVIERLFEKPNEYRAHVAANLNDFYSDFVSRFIIEFAGQLLAWWRIVALPAAKKEYFATKDELDAAIKSSRGYNLLHIRDVDTFDPKELLKITVDKIGHANLAPDAYPYLWLSELARNLLPSNDPMRDFFWKDNIQGTKLADAIKIVSLIRHFYESYAGWGEHNRQACSVKLASVLNKFEWFDSEGQPWYRMFCDKPLPNLITDLLIGLYGYPYHVNLNKLLRLNYIAKSTPMYTDVFVLDQARYLYDLVPTLSLFGDQLDIPLQFILRVCMDAIRRHAYSGCLDLFYGCFLACMGEEGFGVYAWPDRQTIRL